MVLKEFYTTRKDGVKLFKTSSDKGAKIRKIGTDEMYDVAIDVEGAGFEYEETEMKIDEVENYE